MHFFDCVSALVSKCQTEETWELQYNKFHELKSLKNSQVDGYLFKLNFFIFGEKEVHILLSSTEKPNIETESAYEIGKRISIDLSWTTDANSFDFVYIFI